MKAPNEELINNLTIKAGVMEMCEKIAWGSDTALMRQAAATLQSQAERIKVLELDLDVQAGSIEAVQAVNTRQAERIEALEGQLDDATAAARSGQMIAETAQAAAARLLTERDELRAQLAEIENVEPVIWAISYDGVTPYTLWHEGNGPLLDYEVKRQGGTTQKMPLYTRPMPAQDVKDAERYQWLREYMISSATVYDDLIVAANSSVSFDRVIDTALANAKGAK